MQKLTLFYHTVIPFCSSKDEVFSDSKFVYILFHGFKQNLRLVHDMLMFMVVEETQRVIQVTLRFIDVEKTLEDFKDILIFMDVEKTLRVKQAPLRVMVVEETPEV
jgi:hypothetical protein